MSGPTMSDVVAAYMKLRGKKQEIEAKAKSDVAELRGQMDKLAAFILKRMDQDGVTTYKTEHGTAYRSEFDYVSVADWDAVLDFIQKEGKWDLLERRVNKMAVKSMLDEKLPPPPGVNYGKSWEVSFRQPTKEK